PLPDRPEAARMKWPLGEVVGVDDADSHEMNSPTRWRPVGTFIDGPDDVNLAPVEHLHAASPVRRGVHADDALADIEAGAREIAVPGAHAPLPASSRARRNSHAASTVVSLLSSIPMMMPVTSVRRLDSLSAMSAARRRASRCGQAGSTSASAVN